MRNFGGQAGAAMTLAQSRSVFRFVLGRVLISMIVFSVPGKLLARQAQQPSPLTLQQAVNIALEKNPERKAALADTKAA